MQSRYNHSLVLTAFAISAALVAFAGQNGSQSVHPVDAVDQARQQIPARVTRPEQTKTTHDQSLVFKPTHAAPASEVSARQPNSGKVSGFDFYRDPLNAPVPGISPDDIMKEET